MTRCSALGTNSFVKSRRTPHAYPPHSCAFALAVSCSLPCLRCAPMIPCSHATAVQGSTYKAKLIMDVCARRAGTNEEPVRFTRAFGGMPIMLQSRHCHLRHKSRSELIACREEPDEFGGVFICNGIERIIRMLVQQRRHFIMAMNRGAYRKRGANYTPYATLIRCALWLSFFHLLSTQKPPQHSGI